MKKKENKIKVCITLSPKVLAMLKKEAAEKGTNVSALIEMWVRQGKFLQLFA